jgi:hypothetical protein
MSMRLATALLLFITASTGVCAVPNPPGDLTVTTRRLNGGHYIALAPVADSTSAMAALKKPGVRGFIKRYPWRELEPWRGSYDFDEIVTDLQWAKTNGMQLIVFVLDKSFEGQESPVPEYLASRAAPNRASGVTLIRWDATAVNRMKALLTKLAQFDSHPNFEGVALQETAPSLSDATLNAWAYTPEKYRDMYINVLRHGATVMPRSRVFWHMNFLPQNQDYLASIADAVAPYGVVMGGPDILPDSFTLSKVYPLYDQFNERMPLFCSAQYDSYSHLHRNPAATKYWTPVEIFAFGKHRLFIKYLMWTAKKVPDPDDAYTINDAWPVIATGKL